MPRISVDMTNVKENSFEPISEGMHVAQVTKITTEVSKTGNDMLKWEFTIQEGDDTGKKAWIYTVLKEDCLWSLKALLQSLTGEEIPMEELDIDTDDYLGKYIVLDVEHKLDDKTDKVTCNYKHHVYEGR